MIGDKAYTRAVVFCLISGCASATSVNVSPSPAALSSIKNPCPDQLEISVFESQERHLLYIGVKGHTAGPSPLEKCLREVAKTNGVDSGVIHTTGTLESYRSYLKNTPPIHWGEHDFLAEDLLKNGKQIYLSSPDLKDKAEILMWENRQLQNAFQLNLVRHIATNIWVHRNLKKQGLADEQIIDKAIADFVQSQGWLTQLGVWDRIDAWLNHSYPRRTIQQTIHAALNNYARRQGFRNFSEFSMSKELSSESQPLLLAPFPIGKEDINKLIAITHESTNEAELQNIEAALRGGHHVLAETGHAHYTTMRERVAKMVFEKFQMSGREN